MRSAATSTRVNCIAQSACGPPSYRATMTSCCMRIALWASSNFYQGQVPIILQAFRGSPFALRSKRSPQAHWRARRRSRSTGRMYCALSLRFLGFPDRARESCSQGLQLAGQLGHAFTSAQADLCLHPGSTHSRGIGLAPRALLSGQSIARLLNNSSLVLGLSLVIKSWAHVANERTCRCRGRYTGRHGPDPGPSCRYLRECSLDLSLPTIT